MADSLRIKFCRVGHGIVVVIFDVVVGYLIGGGLPYAVMGHDVAQNLVQVLDAVGLANEEGMQGDAHDPPAFSTFFVKLIKLGLTNHGEIICLVMIVSQ